MSKTFRISILLLISKIALAQNQVVLNNLDFWKNPAPNWEIIGEAKGVYSHESLQTSPGTGILHSKAHTNGAADIFSKIDHADAKISFDFMLPKGSNSGIYLQGQYEVQLFDSWGLKTPKLHDCGAIYQRWDPARGKGNEGYEGHAPKVNASLAPGLWQHMDIHFVAPRFNEKGEKISNARFVSIVMNGLELHKNVVLLGPTRGAAQAQELARGPIRIQGDHGEIALRNFQIELLDKATVKTSPVQYSYYEGKFEKIPEKIEAKAKYSGTAEKLNYRLAEKNTDFLLAFNGSIEVPETAEYEISLPATGLSKLLIDNKVVLDKGKHLWRNEENKTNLSLSAGSHTYTLYYTKTFGWGGRALGLFLKRSGVEPQALHEYKSLPDPDPVGLIEVKANEKPLIQRSFVMYNGAKRTHAVNVGEPAGIHYAYDLDKAALLSTWRGKFLNATEMWFERGEPQIAEPLGLVNQLDDKCPIFVINDINGSVVESQNIEKDLTYKGYHYNSERRPIFEYQYKGSTILEHTRPNDSANGLHRNIIFDKNMANTYIRAGESKNISALGNGLYLLGNYYILTKSTNAKIVNIGGMQTLMLPLEGTNVVYEVIF